MAAKRSLKKKASKKRYATQRHINFSPNTGAASNKDVIDVAKFLSESNHRLYRQSRVYKCKINQISVPQDRDSMSVYVLRDTWFLQKAYQMAKATFEENTKEERSGMSPVNMARWQDFRISLTPAAGVTYNFLDPLVVNNNTLGTTGLNNGEFIDTLVTREDSTDLTFGLFGLANSRFGILDEYDKIANVDDSPANTVSGANISAYGGLDDDNDDGSRGHLQTAGNSPPYDKDSLGIDTLFRHVGNIGATTGTQKMSTGFFEAPLGMILVVNTGNAIGTYEVEIASGDYKGVTAENYLE